MRRLFLISLILLGSALGAVAQWAPPANGWITMTSITVTVQNTVGISDVHTVPVDIIKAQVNAVMTDIITENIHSSL
jgi:hypothetical protein